MNIVIDAMGTEQGPGVIIDGINSIAESLKDTELTIVGNEKTIQKAIEAHGHIKPRHTIVNAVNNITMHDSPSMALMNKRDSSIARGIEISYKKEKSAFISMGNTGAVMAFSLKIMGRVKNVMRPALGTVFPVGRHPLLLDVGATPNCKSEMLYQFALMGKEYVRAAWQADNPKIALLSIGTEDTKGNTITQRAFEMLSEDKNIDFYGNIEGNDIFYDNADIIVCDGFVGNVVLKFAEGMASFFKDGLKQIAEESFISKLGMGLAKKDINRYFKKLSYDEYGGAPLLGVNGLTIIGHGKSNAKAVSSAILNAKVLIEHDFLDHIRTRME